MLGHGRSRFPAHAQSCAGQRSAENLAVTRTLGQIACREKHPQYSRALAIPLATPSSQNPRDWGSADGEKHEEAFCRRNGPVSEPGKYVESCTPKLPIRMVKLYALRREP